MKKRLIAATLMFAVFLTSAFAATAYQKSITVDYNINLNINGKTPTLTDVNGKQVQPFTYEGTTYVPIRAVANEMGASVGYDNATQTATITQSVSDYDAYYLRFLGLAAYTSGMFKSDSGFLQAAVAYKTYPNISYYSTLNDAVNSARNFVNTAIPVESLYFNEAVMIVGYLQSMLSEFSNLDLACKSCSLSYTETNINAFFESANRLSDLASKVDQMVLSGATNQF